LGDDERQAMIQESRRQWWEGMSRRFWRRDPEPEPEEEKKEKQEGKAEASV